MPALRSLCFAACALLVTPVAQAQRWLVTEGAARVEGAVLDSASGRPVPGAYVWLVGTTAGAVSDSAGRYSLPWSGYGGHRLVARVCGRENAATGWADARSSNDLLALVDFAVSRPEACAPLPRPPWEVGPSDTTAVSGYLVYSWEGTPGGFLLTCDDEAFSPEWPPGTELWDHRPEEGERQFVRLLGREEDDPYMVNIIPFPNFYVSRVVEKRPPEPDDCYVE